MLGPLQRARRLVTCCYTACRVDCVVPHRRLTHLCRKPRVLRYFDKLRRRPRQSRLLPFVRGVQPPSWPRRHRLLVGESTRSRILLFAGLDFHEVSLPCEGTRLASQPELQWLTNWLTFLRVVAVSVSGR